MVNDPLRLCLILDPPPKAHECEPFNRSVYRGGQRLSCMGLLSQGLYQRRAAERKHQAGLDV